MKIRGMDSFGMRYNWQARALMQNWVKEVHAYSLTLSERSAVGVQNTLVGIAGEEQRCGESVGIAASGLVGLNAILGRGLNINALPREQCRATNMAVGHPRF
jgi:hypothetical protein